MQILVNPNSLKLELAGALRNLKLGRFASINLRSSIYSQITFLILIHICV